jgi:hypothetical protein
MPITFAVDPSKQPSAPLSKTAQERSKPNVESFIQSACPNQTKICGEVLQASFAPRSKSGSEMEKDSELKKMMAIGRGGLVNVCAYAYNQHHHLVLRYVLFYHFEPYSFSFHRLRIISYTDPTTYGPPSSPN